MSQIFYFFIKRYYYLNLSGSLLFDILFNGFIPQILSTIIRKINDIENFEDNDKISKIR